MDIAIVHYHLQTGGVSRVMALATQALSAHDHRIVTLVGELPTASVDDNVRAVDGLQYLPSTARLSVLDVVRSLYQAAQEVLGGYPDVWHFHNPGLGKNTLIPAVVAQLAQQGQRVLIQIHDFAEDGRPSNYQRLVKELALGDASKLDRWLYPQAEQIHYAVLNHRDYGILLKAGVEQQRLHWLPNPIGTETPNEGENLRQPSDHRLWLYPTRAIGRKNVGECLFWAALAEPYDRFALTLKPQNPMELPGYQFWVDLSQRLELPVQFEAGMQVEVTFESLLASAHALLTTSVAEGFGLAYLEPWVMGRAIAGRDLQEITCDFRQQGLELENLYQRIDIPTAWIDMDTFSLQVKKVLKDVYRAYGRHLFEQDVKRALDAWVQDGHIDFAHLGRQQQAAVIERLRGSQMAAEELELSGLQVPDRELVQRNQIQVRSHYGLYHYGVRLDAVYQNLLASGTSVLSTLDAAVVLDGFLSPQRMFLVRG